MCITQNENTYKTNDLFNIAEWRWHGQDHGHGRGIENQSNITLKL